MFAFNFRHFSWPYDTRDIGIHQPVMIERDCFAPLLWFLPGPKRMRGGAAQQVPSDRHFHRGIQAESTS